MVTFISIFVMTLIGAAFGYLVDHIYLWSAIGLVAGCIVSLLVRATSKIPKLLDDLFKV
jgi:F0F1-type ATP synthase assembly protein I